MSILPTSAPRRPTPAAPRAGPRSRADFTLAEPQAPASVPGAAAPAGIGMLLGVQESPVETPRDRAARRHGQESLKLLRALQAALLANDPATHLATQLADHADRAPPADDPGLAAVQRAIAVRAAVELARRG